MSLVFVFVNVFHRANVQLHFISLRLSLTRLSHITLLARAQPSPPCTPRLHENECSFDVESKFAKGWYVYLVNTFTQSHIKKWYKNIFNSEYNFVSVLMSTREAIATLES